MNNKKASKHTEVEEEIIYDIPEDKSGVDFVTKIKKIKEELKSIKKEREEYLDGWQRAKADFINFKKRAEEDKKRFAQYATEDLILQLLPTLDSFDSAFKNREVWESVPKDWRIGMEFIHSQILNTFKNHGVEEIECLHKNFDPQLHHSIDTVEVENEKDDGKIVEVIQKGYKLSDKIIRHPNVKVGVYK
jgi:molecular chaperone GrpE